MKDFYFMIYEIMKHLIMTRIVNYVLQMLNSNEYNNLVSK